jgi:hypothetical protein
MAMDLKPGYTSYKRGISIGVSGQDADRMSRGLELSRNDLVQCCIERFIHAGYKEPGLGI